MLILSVLFGQDGLTVVGRDYDGIAPIVPDGTI